MNDIHRGVTCIHGDWSCHYPNRRVKCVESIEKAEKWDKYVGTGTLQDLIELKDELQRYKNSFHLIKLAGGKEVELAQKLAAVKKICLEQIPSSEGDYYRDQLRVIPFEDILKILEGEQTSSRSAA